jgi:hypothetical protein
VELESNSAGNLDRFDLASIGDPTGKFRSIRNVNNAIMFAILGSVIR